LLAEWDAIQQERSPEVLVGALVRSRTGDPGTSQLVQTETPLEVRFPIKDGKVKIQATPVTLRAGQLDAQSQRTFGTFASGAAAAAATKEEQSASGVGWAVGYKTKGLEVDAGTTPVGFIYQNFTGGVKFNGAFDAANSLTYAVNLSARPVTDSVLSFAGTHDAASGQNWGGVMAAGPRVQISKDFGGYGITGSVAHHDLKGDNVTANSRTEVSAGSYVDISRQADYVLSSGIYVTQLGYEKTWRASRWDKAVTSVRNATPR
jgi:hypothetical protein